MSITAQRVEERKRNAFWIRRLAWLQRLSGRVLRIAYSRTGGRIGGRVRGMPVLLLSTTGRRTGLERTTPLIYVRHNGTYAVAASAAGAERNPSWYHNLIANPAATIQVGSSRIEVTARATEQRERSDLYQLFKASSNAFTAFEESTSRTIPVVVLQPNKPDTLPAAAGNDGLRQP